MQAIRNSTGGGGEDGGCCSRDAGQVLLTLTAFKVVCGQAKVARFALVTDVSFHVSLALTKSAAIVKRTTPTQGIARNWHSTSGVTQAWLTGGVVVEVGSAAKDTQQSNYQLVKHIQWQYELF